MRISISSLFKKKSKELYSFDSFLLKKLKNISSKSSYKLYSNTKIYHHLHSYNIPLLMLDESRGLYLFEIKEWTFQDLKSSDIQKAKNQKSSKETLAFQNTQDIIKNKFNELTHTDGVPIFNYLLMENLTLSDYEHLSDSFKELLPIEKLIFSDSLESNILKKLQNSSNESKKMPSVDSIIGTLFIQYAILSDSGDVHLATDEQINFIDKELKNINILTGEYASGKSSIILLKSIVEILNKSSKKILIIKPTIFACDILKRKLLEIIEHAIIEIDLTSIDIITPIELLNRHRLKLNINVSNKLEIDAKLMKRSFNIADVIMCDDSKLFLTSFIDYLKHIQKKSKLVLVQVSRESKALELSRNFREKNRLISFHKAEVYAKAIHIILDLLEKGSKEIVVVSNNISREKLNENLKPYIRTGVKLLDSSQHLINQEHKNLTIATYLDINELSANHIILLDLSFTSENEIEYAFNLAKKSVDIIYEEDSQEIINLREKYESNKK